MNLNQVTLAGRLTRDVEIRQTPAGTSVCDIGLAVTERVKQDDQWTDKPHFFEVTCWARNAEIVNEYCRKGSLLLLTGRLSFEQWEKDGQKRSKVKVIAERVQLGPRNSERNEHNQEQPKSQQAAAMNQEVPF